MFARLYKNDTTSLRGSVRELFRPLTYRVDIEETHWGAKYGSEHLIVHFSGRCGVVPKLQDGSRIHRDTKCQSEHCVKEMLNDATSVAKVIAKIFTTNDSEETTFQDK